MKDRIFLIIVLGLFVISVKCGTLLHLYHHNRLGRHLERKRTLLERSLVEGREMHIVGALEGIVVGDVLRSQKL